MMKPLSPAMRRLLAHIAKTPHGGRSYDGYPSSLYVVLAGMAVTDGLLKVVKHRDHTRGHRLTPRGEDALRAS